MSRQARYGIGPILGFVGLLSGVPVANARAAEIRWTEDREAPSPVEAHWVDDAGLPTQEEVELRSRWTWNGSGAPTLKTRIEASSGVELRSPQAKVQGPNSLEFESATLPDQLDVTIVRGAPKRYSVVLLSKAERPWLVVAPNCAELGLTFHSLSDRVVGIAWATARCTQAPNGWQIDVNASPPMKATDSSLLIAREGAQAGTVGRFSLGRGKQAFAQEVRWTGEVGEKRWSLSPSLTLGWGNYQEPARGIDLSEATLTARATGSVAVVRRTLYGEAEASATVLPLSLGGATAARFFGLEARVGYRLPWGGNFWDARFYLGGSFWTMSSAANAFGLRLTAPHAKFTLGLHPTRWPPMLLSVKIAPLSDQGFTLQMSNYDLNFGICQTIAGPWAIVGEARITRFLASDSLNRITQTLFELGGRFAL